MQQIEFAHVQSSGAKKFDITGLIKYQFSSKLSLDGTEQDLANEYIGQ